MLQDAVRSISFKRDEFYLTNTEYLSQIEKIVFTKLENHPSPQTVKLNIFIDHIFKFSNIDVSHVFEETTALNNKRNGVFNNILTKRLKKSLRFGYYHQRTS